MPTKTNAELVSNSLARQSAYDLCNIYHQCLLDWHKAADAAVKANREIPAVPMTLHCGQLTETTK